MEASNRPYEPQGTIEKPTPDQLKLQSKQLKFINNFSKTQNECQKNKLSRLILTGDGSVQTVPSKSTTHGRAQSLYKKITGDTNTESMKKALEMFKQLFPEKPKPMIHESALKTALSMSKIIQDYYKDKVANDPDLKKVCDSEIEPFKALFDLENKEYTLKMKEGKLYMIIPARGSGSSKKEIHVTFYRDVNGTGKIIFIADREEYASIDEMANHFMDSDKSPD